MPLRIVLLAGVLATALAVAGPTRAAEDQPPAGSEPVLRVYSIEELILNLPDFPSPDPDATYPSLGPLPTSFCGPPHALQVDEAAIVEMIKHRIAPASWGAGDVSIEPMNGQLVVVQSPEVHRRIEDLLRSIREDARRRLLIRGVLVAVDAKTAAEFRTRKDRVIDARAVEELIKAAGKHGLLASQQVVCHNGQRNHAWSGRWSTYVSGYELDGDMPSPQIGCLIEGPIFDVRPLLSLDGAVATVELRFAAYGDRTEREQQVTFFPVRRDVDTPGQKEDEGRGGEKKTPAPSTQRVLKGDLALPERQVLFLRTSLTVPLDRYVVAGAFPLPADRAGRADGRTALLLVGLNHPGPRVGAVPLKDDEGTGLVQAIFDVRDLTFMVQNFPGPAFSGSQGGTQGGVILAPPPPTEGVHYKVLLDMIRRNVEPASWRNEKASIAEANGKLVITQTPAVQRRIRDYIVSLRAECLPQVAVRCLAVAVSDETAPGVRGRTSLEFTPEEAEALVKDARKGRLLAAPELLCFDRQRANAYAGRELRWVSGYYTGGPVCTPSVETDLWGWALDARPVLSPDRRAATVELRLAMPGSRQSREETVAAQAAPACSGQVTANRITVQSVQMVRSLDCVSVPVGKYVLAKTFRLTGPEAKAAPNVLVLVKVDVVGAEKAK